MATYELLSPAGQIIQFGARPVDLVLSRNNDELWIKDSGRIRLIDIQNWKEIASLECKDGASQTGLQLSPDGSEVLFSDSKQALKVFRNTAGKIVQSRTIEFAKGAYPTGLKFDGNGKLYVCLSKRNSVAVIDFQSGKVLSEIPVGIAPFGIEITKDNSTAFVSCQGGRRPRSGEKTAQSAGSEVAIDERGAAMTGTVSVLNLASQKESKYIQVGLQPSSMRYLPNRNLLVVANSNSDSISFIEASKKVLIGHWICKPDNRLPFGSMPNGIAASKDEKRLYVSLAGNNAVQMLSIEDIKRPKTEGFIPTAWFPGALELAGNSLFICNTKGFGSLDNRRAQSGGRNSHDATGVIQKVDLSNLTDLTALTQKVKDNSRVSEILAEKERAKSEAQQMSVPAKVGDPSTIKHIIYVIKENRTYDQLFGDIKEGDGEPKLCVFPEKITPNHHALAKQFVLLDNYYCSGVLSADGHAWAIEGNVTPYLERSFGGFARSYDFGSDPITYSSSQFVWDHVLGNGLSFWNFGECDSASLPTGWKLSDVWRAYDTNVAAEFGQSIEIERLKRYSSRDYPGWNMAIPDVLRADRFIAQFRKWESAGKMPSLTILYLPQDHTAGTSPGYPTIASYLGDNDLALGRVIDAVTKSQFWKDTVIFVNEDDPQAGFDHIDGHRSICLVVSPYAKRGKTVSQFYNQDSVLHTIFRILGMPASNQKIAMSPLMTACFQANPDYSGYDVRDPQVDLRKINPPISSLSGESKRWAQESSRIKFDKPDFRTEKEDDTMNRIIWHAMKGSSTPYPAQWAGAHGKGLRKRGLKVVLDEDDR